MLINFSNHPYFTWPESQQFETIERFGSVVDVAFPAIDVHWTEAELIRQALLYRDELICLHPDAVYVVGEHVFTFIMVRLLQQKGIRCVNALSKRRAIENEDGTYLRYFQFEGFREYPVV